MKPAELKFICCDGPQISETISGEDVQEVDVPQSSNHYRFSQPDVLDFQVGKVT